MLRDKQKKHFNTFKKLLRIKYFGMLVDYVKTYSTGNVRRLETLETRQCPPCCRHPTLWLDHAVRSVERLVVDSRADILASAERSREPEQYNVRWKQNKAPGEANKLVVEDK